MREKRNAYRGLMENLTAGGNLEDLGIDWKIILKPLAY
jgi:hypothetical protein